MRFFNVFLLMALNAMAFSMVSSCGVASGFWVGGYLSRATVSINCINGTYLGRWTDNSLLQRDVVESRSGSGSESGYVFQ